jgi:hypothetical protein
MKMTGQLERCIPPLRCHWLTGIDADTGGEVLYVDEKASYLIGRLIDAASGKDLG